MSPGPMSSRSASSIRARMSGWFQLPDSVAAIERLVELLKLRSISGQLLLNRADHMFRRAAEELLIAELALGTRDDFLDLVDLFLYARSLCFCLRGGDTDDEIELR